MKIGLGGSHRALQDVFDNSMQLNLDEKVAESLMKPREQLRATLNIESLNATAVLQDLEANCFTNLKVQNGSKKTTTKKE